jgi:hypothetical protein
MRMLADRAQAGTVAAAIRLCVHETTQVNEASRSAPSRTPHLTLALGLFSPQQLLRQHILHANNNIAEIQRMNREKAVCCEKTCTEAERNRPGWRSATGIAAKTDSRTLRCAQQQQAD